MARKRRQGQLRDLAEGLVKVGALQFGTFTLPDGSVSSYYVNLRGLASYPGVYRLVVDLMGQVLSKAPKTDALCCVPLTGLAIAAPVAVAQGKPLVYLRSGKQPNESALEGEIRPGWKVVVVDDLVTSGSTILSAARAVEQEGGEVRHAAVLIDRLEGGREALTKQGITLHSLTDILELADILLSMELISEANLKAITKTVGGR